jgi:hypothetical protein
MSAIIESNDIDIPPEQTYILEAAKRKRIEGNGQFDQLHFSENKRLRSLIIDPWADHSLLDQLPLPIENGGRVKFLILGTGIGGLVMAVKLIRSAFAAEDVVFIETGGGVGGTWYWNR